MPIVPTTVVAASSDPAATLDPHQSATVVVKPAVGIGGNDAERGRADDPALREHLAALLAVGDVLVQPYVASIETSGETSLIVFDDRVSHAVTKRPAGGEFRIHDHRGGTYGEVEPSREQHELAVAAREAASSITGHRLLYARADLVAGDDGRSLLMELELIEPSLYLHTVPSATAALADAIVAAVG